LIRLGKTFRIGANYTTSKKTVSTTTDPALSGTVLIYSYRDGSGGFSIDPPVTDIDPILHDDGTGVLAAVPSGSYTLQPLVFFAQSNVTAVQYGQGLFDTLELAEQSHTEDTTAANPDLQGGTVRGWIALKWDATDLTDTDQATFITAGKFGVAGSTTGASAGEINTATNVGTAGVGPFKAKVGAVLQFKNINAGSSKITISDDTGDDEIDIDIDQSQLDHGSIAGLADDDHPQYLRTDGTRNVTGPMIFEDTVSISGDIDIGQDLVVGGSGVFTGDISAANLFGDGSSLIGVSQIDLTFTAASAPEVTTNSTSYETLGRFFFFSP